MLLAPQVWLLASLAAGPQAFVISLADSDIGFAELTLEPPTGGAKLFRYRWHAELAVSGEPCLRSSESSAGQGVPTDAVLPEELFVALAPAIGPGCRQVRLGGGRTRGATGRGCWTEADDRRAVGQLLSSPIAVDFAANGLPVAVRYPELGLAYRAVAEVPEGLARCLRTAADDGVAAPGADGFNPRQLRAATYDLGHERVQVRSPAPLPMPTAVREALTAVRRGGPGSCQEAAEALRRALGRKVAAVRTVSGLLLDEGRWYPHAWTEVRLSAKGDWLPLDATTGEGWADAGRLSVGSLEAFQTGLTLLARLHTPPRILSHE